MMSLRAKRVALLRLSLIPVIFVGLFVWRSWDDEGVVDFVVEWAGYLLLLLGMAIRFWSLMCINQRKSKVLVTEGPYSLSRNPLYVGTLFIAVGASLCLENFLMLIVVLVLLVPVHLWAIGEEERRLGDLFGPVYQEYRARTPRFLSFTRRNYRGIEAMAMSAAGLRRAMWDSILVMLIPLAGDLIELLHARGVLPVLWRPF
jgi:protein-S-isoprenylcysteine O-methyltransferase Ste14